MVRYSRRAFLSAIGLGGTLSVAGCIGKPVPGTTSAEQFTDMAGRSVRLPETVDRVVGVGPGALRLLCHLEMTDSVVAVELPEHDDPDWTPPYNLANPQFRDLPTAGPQHGGDAEAILRQEPDLIVAATPTPDVANQLQSRTDAPTIWVDQGDFGGGRESLYDAWRTIGRAVRKPERAVELVEFVESVREDVAARAAEAGTPPSTYVGAVSHRGGKGLTSTEIPFPPLSMLGTGSVAAGILEEGGSESDGGTVKRTVSGEKLLEWDPETMFLNLWNLSIVREEVNGSGFSELSAVRHDGVYGVHPHYFYHYNPSTMLANTYYMGTVLYPDAFADVEPAAAANRVYETFLGTELYSEVEDAFGSYGPVELPE